MHAERAIIDIGSNTVRLAIYGGPARAPVIRHNEKVTAKLGKGVAETGLLADKASAAALAALARFALLLEVRGIRDVQTVATAAVRDAENGGAFLEKVSALGLSPRLLSGEEEALASARGVQAAFPGARGVVADLGGGSLELVHVEGDRSERGASLPYGTLRLPGLRAGGTAKFARGLRKALDVAEWHCSSDEALYLVGGTFRALGRFAQGQIDWPIDDPHGFALTSDAAARLCRSLGRGPLAAAGAAIPASRRAALPDAAALLAVLLRELQPSRVVFSGWGLREGLLMARQPAAVWLQDPLLAGAVAFAETMGGAPSAAVMVAGWTAGTNLPDAGPNENLRLAATTLTLAARRLEPNLRADASRLWALRKRWIGVSAQGRAMIAACMLASTGKPFDRADLLRLASAEEINEAVAWGLAIRLCYRLSSTAPLVLSNSALAADGANLVLTLREPYAALCTDTVQKDLRALAEHLGLAPLVRQVPAQAALD